MCVSLKCFRTAQMLSVVQPQKENHECVFVSFTLSFTPERLSQGQGAPRLP